MTSSAENFLRPDRAPEDGGGEEGVDARAREVVWLVGGADVGYLVDLEVEDARADECADKGCDHLREERMAGWDLDVVGKLEVVGESERVGAGYISISSHHISESENRKKTEFLELDIKREIF